MKWLLLISVLWTFQAQAETEIPCYKAEPKICEIEHWVLKYTNDYRRSKKRRSTKYSEQLAYAAREWSKQRKRKGKAHKGFPRARRASIKQEFGEMNVRVVAENVYWRGHYNSFVEVDAKRVAWQIFAGWRGSRGHRKNMLSYSRKYQGVGVSFRNGYLYATQLFGR